MCCCRPAPAAGRRREFPGGGVGQIADMDCSSETRTWCRLNEGSCGSGPIAGGPSGKFSLYAGRQFEDRRGDVGAVVMLFVFGRFHQNRDQVDVAGNRDDPAGVFTLVGVAFQYGGLQRAAPRDAASRGGHRRR